MQNDANADIELVDTCDKNKNSNTNSLEKNALLRLAEIFINIDKREHIIDRNGLTGEA